MAVFLRHQIGQYPSASFDPAATIFEVLLIKDAGHFAIRSGLFHVVVAGVVDDFQHLVHQVFDLTLARDGVRAAKFLMAGEPAEYRGSGRHRGIGTDGPKAFTVDKPVADRFSDFGAVAGRTAALGVDVKDGQILSIVPL